MTFKILSAEIIFLGNKLKHVLGQGISEIAKASRSCRRFFFYWTNYSFFNGFCLDLLAPYFQDSRYYPQGFPKPWNGFH